LTRLHRLVARGLDQTAELFAPVRELFGWVSRAAHELSNPGGLTGARVRGRWASVIRGMGRCAARRAELAGPLRHFVKVSRSYEPGLFHCYDMADLPRTNNDLEHAFGSHRYHERRASGRRRASPGLVVMGSARLISGVATRLRPEEGLVLAPGYVEAWRELRADLEKRRESRRKQRRFRHDPAAYLKELEQRCLQLSLPP
jgi:hypothetical protein